MQAEVCLDSVRTLNMLALHVDFPNMRMQSAAALIGYICRRQKERVGVVKYILLIMQF